MSGEHWGLRIRSVRVELQDRLGGVQGTGLRMLLFFFLFFLFFFCTNEVYSWADNIRGYVALAVSTPNGTYTREIETGSGDRERNMEEFAGEALRLVVDVLEGRVNHV